MIERSAVLAAAAVVASGMLGCGSPDAPDPSEAASTTEKSQRVELEVTSPDDGHETRHTQMLVRGTVDPPDAAVQVAGSRASVSDGAFSATTSLDRGGNSIDVIATASGAKAANTTIDITRLHSRAELAAIAKRRRAARAERAAAREAEARERAEREAAEEAERVARQAADNYPADIRANFITGCTIEGSKSQCECALEKVEKKFSLEQYLTIDQLAAGGGQLPPSFERVFVGCLYS